VLMLTLFPITKTKAVSPSLPSRPYVALYRLLDGDSVCNNNVILSLLCSS
jgi:hypothetical protein